MSPNVPARLRPAQKSKNEGQLEQRRIPLVEEQVMRRVRKVVVLVETGFARIGIFVHLEGSTRTQHPKQEEALPPQTGSKTWEDRAKKAALVLGIVLMIFQIPNEAVRATNRLPSDAQAGRSQVIQGGIYAEDGNIYLIGKDQPQ